MKVPDYKLCSSCRHASCPRWFLNKIDEWEDMDYPYVTFGPSLITIGKRDLCEECFKKIVEAYDAANGYRVN